MVPCQAELFDVCGISELVDAALDGFNVTGARIRTHMRCVCPEHHIQHSCCQHSCHQCGAAGHAGVHEWAAFVGQQHIVRHGRRPAQQAQEAHPLFSCTCTCLFCLAAVFAFGQTGSGKTYSILGPGMAGMQGFEEDSPAGTAAGQHSSSSISSAHPGAAELDTAGTAALSNSPAASNSSSQDGPRTPQRELPEHEGLLVYCVHHLFGSIAACRNSLQCSVTISCTEVYNETVTDMLARNNKSQQLPVG